MKTKDLGLKIDWIMTYSLYIGWYSSGEMNWKDEMKNGKWHGEDKVWRRDGSIWSHRVWKNGRVVKNIV